MKSGDDGQVVQHQVSRFGYHQLHVLKLGSAPSLDWWMVEAQLEGADSRTFMQMQYREEGVYHLWLWWECYQTASSCVEAVIDDSKTH